MEEDRVSIMLRALVAVAVTICTTLLGIRGVLDPQGVTAIFVAVIGLYGTAGIMAARNGGSHRERT